MPALIAGRGGVRGRDEYQEPDAVREPDDGPNLAQAIMARFGELAESSLTCPREVPLRERSSLPMILLHTNVVSELMRPEPDVRVRQWVSGQRNEQLDVDAGQAMRRVQPVRPRSAVEARMRRDDHVCVLGPGEPVSPWCDGGRAAAAVQQQERMPGTALRDGDGAPLCACQEHKLRSLTADGHSAPDAARPVRARQGDASITNYPGVPEPVRESSWPASSRQPVAMVPGRGAAPGAHSPVRAGTVPGVGNPVVLGRPARLWPYSPRLVGHVNIRRMLLRPRRVPKPYPGARTDKCPADLPLRAPAMADTVPEIPCRCPPASSAGNQSASCVSTTCVSIRVRVTSRFHSA